MPRVPLPGPDEYAPYYGRYIEQLRGDDPFDALERQAVSTARLLAATAEEKGAFRYAPGKWSAKEVVGHLSDCERVFAFRALWFARASAGDLPGFDENAWAPEGRFDARPLSEIAAEFAAVRASTLAMVQSFGDTELVRRGVANGQTMSVRAAVAVLAGHERHHVAALREKYGLPG